MYYSNDDSSILYGSTTLVGKGLLTVELPPSNSEKPLSVGVLWARDQPIAEN
jgi:hypothetical protein